MIMIEKKMEKEKRNRGERWFKVYKGLCEEVVGKRMLKGKKMKEEELD